MPQGESPYLPLIQFAVRQLRARGGFLYVDDGMYGDGWAVWAPPEVTARLPEFIADAAADLEAQGTERSSSLVAPAIATGDTYRDAAEAACKAAEGAWAFLFLLEGKGGTAWSMFAPPALNPLAVAELMRGFAEDLKGEEPVLRGDASLN